MESHYEIKLEKYAQLLNIEVETMLEMINKDILPAAYKYIAAVSRTVVNLRAVVPSAKAAAESALLTKLDALTGDLAAKTESLAKIHLAAKASGDVMAVAKAYADKVIPAMAGSALLQTKLNRCLARNTNRSLATKICCTEFN